MTQDILELAKECGLACKRFDCCSPKALERFAAAIQQKEAEKWQARVAELEEALSTCRESEPSMFRTFNASKVNVALSASPHEVDELREVVRKAGEQTNYLGHITDQELIAETCTRFGIEPVAFDYASAPIGSRDCGLQWKAYQTAYMQALREIFEYLIAQDLATGHGDTVNDVLQELDEQLRERYTKQGRADMHRDACNHVRSRNCATGHADTIEELLLHFEEQIIERLTIEGLK
jgi:hypothetical protein